MNLTSYLIEGLLPEQEKKKVVAVYGGGFKPPTSGHFEVAKQALKENPDIDEFIIYIGGKERNGISPDESILIWDIYKQYLPYKVEVKYTSVPPIKSIYNYAKEHPDEEVLFIIGAREGNEEDFKDIASRTTTLDKYPNLNLRTIVTQGGVSGTAARNASKISLEKFKPFVPSELSDEEIEQVYNIVADKIQENDPEDGKSSPYGSGYKKLNENITKSQLDALEAYADKLFAKLGIDIEFTRHFLDRANDKRNIKPISIPELMGMFKRLHKKHGKPLSKVDNDFDAVVKDFNSNINIPFAINVTPNDIDLVAKTVMRKKDFKTSTPVISLNENASYSKEINIKEKIAQLTSHMIDKGMNIEPLPSMEFVDGDSENAKDFFGKTAYYDPNRQHIVLYTEGRHPKDIVRSYAHEMIHHIQNLEDRLGDISGTNTTEDDHLDKLEQEANLKGTMTFRNWTDSLNESLQPTYTMYSGITGEAWEKIWKNKNFIDKVTNVTNDEDFALDYSYNFKTGKYEDKYVEISNIPLNAFVSVRDRDYEDDDDFESIEGLDSEKKINAIKYNDLFLVNLFPYKSQIKTKLVDNSLNETIVGDKIECDNCDWSWDISSGGNDLYTCHKCWHDNTPIDENKDPFGINAYARELGQLNEKVMDYKIYCDMDGVLVDFESGYEKLTGIDLKGEYRPGVEDFWKPIEQAGVKYWASLKWMPDGKQLWGYIKQYTPELLSAPSKSESSKIGKYVWVKNNLPGTKLILRYASRKKELANPESILIDDRQVNINQWEAAGGIGILHTSTDNTIQQLQKLGL